MASTGMASTGMASTGMEGIGNWPARWAALAPEGCAIRWCGEDITWHELETRVAACANALRELGVGPGDRVGCLMTNCPEFLVAVFATTRLGALFVPLNTRLAAPELAYIAGDAGVSVIATEAAFDAVLAA